MITIKHNSQCCGCGACADLCPDKCISMIADREGFLYAKVDATKCLECGMCERVCPMTDSADNKSQASKAYAAWSKSDDIHTTSTSGGAAYEMGRLTLNKGGVVYGCSGVDPYHVRHVRIDNITDLSATQGSKYVQSSTVGIFRQLRKDVATGRPVLFVGTPCQAAAVRNLFGKRTPENLLIVDIICHGVPSQKMLNRQLDTIARKKHLTSIKSISFRQSDNPDNCLVITGLQRNELVKVEQPAIKNPYYKSFLYGLNFRESCYKCPGANSKRAGDITIGDFWGFKVADTLQFRQEKGLSLILPNTLKGQRLFEEISTVMSVVERPLTEAIEGNPHLNRPVEMSWRVNAFRLLNIFMPDSITSKAVFIDKKFRLRK